MSTVTATEATDFTVLPIKALGLASGMVEWLARQMRVLSVADLLVVPDSTLRRLGADDRTIKQIDEALHRHNLCRR